jgi:predicted transposase YbfD/YdcC
MTELINFLSCFRDIEDPRVPGLVTYPIDELILSTFCAVLCRNQDWEEISCWTDYHLEWLRKFLPFRNGAPSPSTYARFFNALDSKKFKNCFESWVSSFGLSLKEKQIAIDGKTIRGSKHAPDGSGSTHLVSAFAHEYGLVIGQEKVDNKSNEITAIPELIKRLALEGSIISIDAIATQKDIVKEIVKKKADYLIGLKANQPSLYEDVRLFFEENSDNVVWDEHEDTDAGHGRIEVRKAISTKDIGWLKERHPDWDNLNSIVVIESLRINKKTMKETREKRYYISSLMTSAKAMGEYVRNHWSIENKLHWILDMSFKEDSCRTRIDHGAENLGIIRKIAINQIRNKSQPGEKKISVKRKLLKGNWDLGYLESLIC